MSNKEDLKAQEENLKNLEEQAYFELCQIIAEAIELQDVKVLNSRLSAWKTKYKKLLDGSTPNSALIEKIKRLQSDNYIGYIIDMIMQRIAIKEHIKINNQLKALQKLYVIIKETNDFKTLKSKVEEWEKTYPVQSFMRMYQKKVSYYTSTKTLEENSFNQEKAFYDLIQITKIDKPEEIKVAINNWEETYSIHDKFELDDFIKNQTEVKRYVEEIESKANSKPEDIENQAQETNKQFSDINKQAIAVDSLLAIIGNSNNLNKVFEWVHKNSSIKFNDEFKSLILSKTSLEYSPKYLTQLKAPNINVLSSSLSLDEYREIDNIKRYAIISYFNLLLPKEQAIPNNYFDNYVEDIYYKSRNVKIEDNVVSPKPAEKNTMNSTKETNLSGEDSTSIFSQDKKETIKIETILPNTSNNSEPKLDTNDESATISSKTNNDSTQENEPTELEVDVNTIPEIEEPKLQAENDIPETKTPELDYFKDAKPETIIDNSDTIKENPQEDTQPVEQQEFIPFDDLDIMFEQSLEKHPDSFEIDLNKPTKDWHKISDTEESTFTEYSDDSNSTSTNLEQNIDTVLEEAPVQTVIDNIPESITHSEVEIAENSYTPENLNNNLVTSVSDDINNDEEIDIVAYSPLFFDTIYNLSIQASLIQKVDMSVEQFEEPTQSRNTIDLEKNNNV